MRVLICKWFVFPLFLSEDYFEVAVTFFGGFV